jgi:hypothetical protein
VKETLTKEPVNPEVVIAVNHINQRIQRIRGVSLNQNQDDPQNPIIIEPKNVDDPRRTQMIFGSHFYNGGVVWPVERAVTDAMRYGQQHEPNALNWLKTNIGVELVEDAGNYTFFHPQHPTVLAATPDAITKNGYVVEVKCTNDINKLNKDCGFCKNSSLGSFKQVIKMYGDQIQAQMACTNLKGALLVLYHREDDNANNNNGNDDDDDDDDYDDNYDDDACREDAREESPNEG